MGFRSPLTTVSADQLEGQLTADQIAGVYALSILGQLTNAQLAGIAADKITGQLTDSQIAAIAAGKISGTISSAQIASVAAGKVTGQLTNAQLAAIDAAKVTGQLTAAQIASVAAVAVTGQLTAAQIASLAANQITGQLTASQIAAVSAAAITGQLAGTQLAADSIDGKTINGATINGGVFQTFLSGARAVLSALTVAGGPVQGIAAATLALFSGHSRETSAGGIAVDGSAHTYVMSPILSGQTAAGPGYAELELNAADGPTPSEATLVAGNIFLIPLGGGTLYLGPLSFSGASDVAVQMNVASLDIAPNSLNDTRVPVRIGGRQVPNSLAGVSNVTSDGSGNVVITHNLGVATHALHALASTATPYSFEIITRSANTTTLRIYRVDTGAVATGVTMNLYWTVTAY